MDLHETLRRLYMDGFYIVEGVIPRGDVGAVREEVQAVVEENRRLNEAMQRNVRSRGHRIRASGVASAGGLINHLPSFGKYLADERITGTCEKIFVGRTCGYHRWEQS